VYSADVVSSRFGTVRMLLFDNTCWFLPVQTSAHRIRFGPFELDVSSGELRKGRTRLKVPYQSTELLKALLERPGELVTRHELRQRLWPSNTFVDFEHGLNAAIRGPGSRSCPLARRQLRRVRLGG
jgi:DNA-binding response OmpR family regulator